MAAHARCERGGVGGRYVRGLVAGGGGFVREGGWRLWREVLVAARRGCLVFFFSFPDLAAPRSGRGPSVPADRTPKAAAVP